MKSLMLLLAATAALLLTAGCVHFDYSGSDAPVTGAEVAVIQDVPQPAESQLLGKALVWGNYQDVSRDRMLDRLEQEAKARGANAVRITAEQVVPMGTVVTVNPMVQTMETVSPTNAYSLNELQKDFEGGYGQAELFGKKAKQPAAATGHDYKRIIRAEFLLCKNPVKMVRRGRVKPAAKPEAKQEAKQEAKPEAKQEAKPEAKPAAKPEAKPEAKPAPAPAAKPEAKPAK